VPDFHLSQWKVVLRMYQTVEITLSFPHTVFPRVERARHMRTKANRNDSFALGLHVGKFCSLSRKCSTTCPNRSDCPVLYARLSMPIWRAQLWCIVLERSQPWDAAKVESVGTSMWKGHPAFFLSGRSHKVAEVTEPAL
jgi:hypothetical protein